MTGAVPRFSVVIPAYNAEACVGQALADVAAQTFRDFEVIVVDDGSKDRTSATAEEQMAALNLPGRVVRQENRGPGAARNTGIRLARGEWVAFFDVDDRWAPFKLERVAERATAEPDVHLICHDEELVRPDGSKRRIVSGPAARDQYARLLLRGNCISTSATCVRRSILEREGGFLEDRSIDSAEDYDLWLRLAKSGSPMSFIPEVCGEYHHTDSSISLRAAKHADAILRVLAKHGSSSGLRDRHPVRWRRRHADVLYGKGLVFHRQGAWHEAVRAYMGTLRLDPTHVKAIAAAAAARLHVKV